MYYLYSTNDKPGAKLIRWGGRDKCSHFAKYYPSRGTVVESRVDTGVRELPIGNWLRENRVVFADRMKFQNITDGELYGLDQPIIGKRYDKKAILFKAFTTILSRLFSWMTFRENKWGAKDQYFCLEIVLTHKDILEAHNCPMDYDVENLYPEEFHEILGVYDFVESVDPASIGS